MMIVLREPLEIRRIVLPHEPIGEGAMGEVFGALDPDTGQRFAVKFLRRELANRADLLARFREEAEITAAVDHESGVPVYGMGTAPDGRPFYVMRRVEGRTLRALLDERGTHVADLIWRERLLTVFGEICDAIAFAHARGIVHRDLKPGNVLIDEHGSVTVIDWGLAKRIGRNRSTAIGAARTVIGDVMGTPGYMAPEQAAGASVDAGPPADVFALGAILYEILTGTKPFSGATPRESLLATIHRDPPDLRRTGRWLWFSRSLIAICGKALEKDPQRRYATAEELARDLRSLRNGRPTSATRPSWLERVGWAARRRPGAFAGVGALSGAIVLGLLIVVAQSLLDARLADKAFEQIAQRDLQVEKLTQALRDLNRQRTAAIGRGDERALDLQRIELDTRRLLLRLDAIYLLRGVVQLRFIRRDPRLIEMIKSRTFDALRSALDLGEPAMTKALAAALAVRGSDVVLSAEENERLRALLEEADMAFVEATKNRPE